MLTDDTPTPDGPLQVRRATLDDLPAAAALFDQYRQFQGQPAAPLAAQDFLQQRLARDEAVVFLAESVGRPLGLAVLYPLFSSVALQRVFILNDLFVRPGARRRGIGRALLDAVAAHARDQHACRLSLNVARTNLEAQQVYDAMGWQRDREFFAYHLRP